jgi:hypothetical protein
MRQIAFQKGILPFVDQNCKSLPNPMAITITGAVKTSRKKNHDLGTTLELIVNVNFRQPVISRKASPLQVVWVMRAPRTPARMTKTAGCDGGIFKA